MGNILQLSDFRKKKRQVFYRKNGDKLERFINTFLDSHVNIDFTEIAERYVNQRISENEEVWDYLDLREALREAFSLMFGEKLKIELQLLWWFDLNLVGVEEMVDRCLSTYILSNGNKIAKTSNE